MTMRKAKLQVSINSFRAIGHEPEQGAHESVLTDGWQITFVEIRDDGDRRMVAQVSVSHEDLGQLLKGRDVERGNATLWNVGYE